MIRDESIATTSLTGLPVGNGYAPADGVDVAYDLTSDPANLYIGYAPLGSSQANPVWTIKRIAQVSGTPVATQWTGRTAVWNNRASESYS